MKPHWNIIWAAEVSGLNLKNTFILNSPARIYAGFLFTAACSRDELTRTFTSVLLKAWKVLVVSVLGLSSVFFTSVSFTTGADEDDAGDGFCGGFWALRMKEQQVEVTHLWNDQPLSECRCKYQKIMNFSSPYVSFAWCNAHNTTQASGHLLLYLSPGACDSPGGTDYGTPGTPPTGFPW